jgi:hypothetical protein
MSMMIYYIVFILITYFPRGIVDVNTKFLLYPNFKEDIQYHHNTVDYYLNMFNIGMNIFGQIIILNFYFIIIKQMILRDKTVRYIRSR